MDKNTKIVIAVIGIILLIGFTFLLSTFILNVNTANVAVIPIYGSIDFSHDYGSTHPDDIKNIIENANNDFTIDAIVLDINSPGGTSVAADEISYAVKNSKKPVVAWISDLGASAAYLIASNADKIVASRNSLVGNIGTIIELEDNSEQYKKNGTKKYVIKAGEYKDIMSDYRNMTDNESAMIQTIVNEDYDSFVSDVAKNRNLSINYTKNIAEGKIYSGKQALKVKLVDSVGLKEDALQLAALLTGKNDYFEINQNYNLNTNMFVSEMIKIIDKNTDLSLKNIIE